jgi:hypothetical protein
MDADEFLNDIEIGLRGVKEFEVQVTVPEDFVWPGHVPYDIHILKDQAFVTVPANTIEEAKRLAEEYFNGQPD